MSKIKLFFLLFFFSKSCILFAQDLFLSQLHKLKKVGTVLYIAAHPDDENTGVITWLSQGEHLHTCYLSLTRGDGGQNLIGAQKGTSLGVIRTEELLEARKIDHGAQFFTSAYDFGFSKTHQETFTFWNQEKLLEEVVFLIRYIQPSIIITRFPLPNPSVTTHGHHTASAILAFQAFRAAADPDQFKKHLHIVSPWQAERIYWNISSFFFANNPDKMPDKSKLVMADIGQYNQLLGTSYPQIAALSRSAHKSQGFGTAATFGERIEWFEPLDGKPAPKNLLEKLDFSWNKYPNGKKISALIDKIIKKYKPGHIEMITHDLVDLYNKIIQIPSQDYILKQKALDVKKLIQKTLALHHQANTLAHTITKNTLKLHEKADFSFLSITQNSQTKVVLDSYQPYFVSNTGQKYFFEKQIVQTGLVTNVNFKKTHRLVLIDSLPVQSFSTPYWLEQSINQTFFQYDYMAYKGAPKMGGFYVDINYLIDGKSMSFQVPIEQKNVDPVKGEYYLPLYLMPEMTVVKQEKNVIFNQGNTKNIQVTIQAWADNCVDTLHVKIPQGWTYAGPDKIPVRLTKKGEKLLLNLAITPPKQSTQTAVELLLFDSQGHQLKTCEAFDFDHITPSFLLQDFSLMLNHFDVKILNEKIAYYTGAQDELIQSLRQLGYEVFELTEQNFEQTNLSEFDVIVLGIRALNTRKNIALDAAKMKDFVENGGKIIVQYNTTNNLLTDPGLSMFDIGLSRNRVTEEHAPVRIFDLSNALWRSPNQITLSDFDGWQQERALYLPAQWDKSIFQTFMSTQDAGQPAQESALLIAQYGKGYFIYTSIAWFRQLPNAVQGAFKIFANIISYQKNQP